MTAARFYRKSPFGQSKRTLVKDEPGRRYRRGGRAHTQTRPASAVAAYPGCVPGERGPVPNWLSGSGSVCLWDGAKSRWLAWGNGCWKFAFAFAVRGGKNHRRGLEYHRELHFP
ncbi:hypothetical protein MTO96_008044 [Rhipicephalus appendiculatus]